MRELALGLLVVAPAAATCVDDGTCVVIERGSFPSGDWTTTCSALAFGGTGPGACGGILPDFSVAGTAIRRTTFEFPALLDFEHVNYDRDHFIWVGHFLADGTVWDPATQGPLAGLLYRETRTAVSFVANYAALLQDGVVYRTNHLPPTAPSPAGFEVHQSGCLRATSFVADNANGLPTGASPDFSAAGSPIQFGYQQATRDSVVNTASSYSESHDDLRYVLFGAANPNCLGAPPPTPPQPGLEVTKTTSPPDHLWSFGPPIPYEMTVTNAGAVAAADVVLGDFVPNKTTYQPDASATLWTCDPGPGEGSFCTTDVGDLAPGEAVTVDFPVLVNEGTPAGWEVFNEVFVDSYAGSAPLLAPSGPVIRSATGTRRSSAAFDVYRGLEPRQDQICENVWWVTLDLIVAGAFKCCIGAMFGFATSSGFESCSELLLCVSVVDDDAGSDDANPTERSGHTLPLQRELASNPPADTTLDVPVLYRLRDRIFRRTPGGRRATDLSVAHIGDLGATSAASPDAHQRAIAWYLGWQPLLRRLIAGRGDTVTVTAGHAQLLVDYVASLKASATTPALLDALELEEARLDIPSWVGMDVNEWLQAINVLSCEPGDRVLCLNDGRFRVEAEWLTDKGLQGHGHAVPLSGDTGYFWFFNDDNVELVLKVLDACPSGFHNYWVFAGGLTDVEVLVTVTDTETGLVRTYENPQKTRYQPIQDTSAFATCDAPPRAGADRIAARARHDGARPPGPTQPSILASFVERLADGTRRLFGVVDRPALVSRIGSCSPSATTLCLNQGRFAVTAAWETVAGASGSGHPVPLTADTGYFWFFNQENVEIVVKTLDACAGPFDSFWVFAAGLTDVKVDLTVLDTVTGQIRVYRNPQKTRFLPIQDTAAFKTCAGP